MDELDTRRTDTKIRIWGLNLAQWLIGVLVTVIIVLGTALGHHIQSQQDETALELIDVKAKVAVLETELTYTNEAVKDVKETLKEFRGETNLALLRIESKVDDAAKVERSKK